MPRVPIDYANTIIYKLVHKDDLYDENIYTGHTTDFICRKNHHKSLCNNSKKKEYNQKKYKNIRENGGWDEWLMIEIEKYPCKDKPEAVARERVIQTEMKAKLNSLIAGRTPKEYREDNKEIIAIKKKNIMKTIRKTKNNMIKIIAKKIKKKKNKMQNNIAKTTYKKLKINTTKK